jgi:hypothetical protein
MRVAGGEDLGDGPAGVVGDEIDASEPERVAEVLQASRQRGDGQVLPGGHRAAPVQREVDGNVASLGAQRADDVAPEKGVGGDAMHEQRHGPGPLRVLPVLRGLRVFRALRGLRALRADVDVADLA